MASLTPGVLSKLIENAGNKDFKVTGQHRSPLLQVLQILPSLPVAGDDQNDPWRSRGFFLKLSDSLHAAYAALSDADLDLIYSDKIQLGQFVHVTRFDQAGSGSQVPIIRGLKPVSRRRPCVGSPTDLVSSDALPISRAAASPKRPAKSKPQAKKVEPRRLSLDSARRGWDQGPPPSAAGSPPMTPKFSPRPRREVGRKDVKLPAAESAGSRAVRVAVDLKTGFEKKIAWKALPSAVAVAGKRAVGSRNVAFMGAVHALEEASATESVLHCMCLFAELCDSWKQVSAGSLAEKFLQLYQRIQQAHSTLNSLLNKNPSAHKNNNATSWIQAAIATNLSKFNLFETRDKLEAQTRDRQLYVVIENATTKLDSPKPSPTNCKSHPSNPSAKLPHSSKREEWCKGSGLKEAAELAEELLLVSRRWFVKYLEDLLGNSFGITRGEGAEVELLRQLKRVNQWMNELTKSEVEIDNRMEQLSKKLYKFLLDHVNVGTRSSQ